MTGNNEHGVFLASIFSFECYVYFSGIFGGQVGPMGRDTPTGKKARCGQGHEIALAVST